MKFSFSTLGCPDWPVEKIILEAKKLGYDGIEIRGIKRVFDLSKTPEFAPENIAKTRRLFEDAKLPVVSVNASSSFCWPDPAKQKAALDEAEKTIDIASKMGAQLMRVFGGNIPEGEPREKWAKILADHLKMCGEMAAKKGVTVIIESHDSWTKSDELIPVIKAVNMPSVRPLWDMGNSFEKGEKFNDGAKWMKGYVVHVHIKDRFSTGKYSLLGKGEIPIPDALQALKSIGYTGYMSLEWEKAWHPEIEEPEIAFPQAISYLRKVDAAG